MKAWLVKPATQPLLGEISVPGDKSMGHRAILFAGLAHGKSIIRGLSGGADNARTENALARMGATFEKVADGLCVVGTGIDGLGSPGDVYCGNSGTTMRLLCGLMAGARVSGRLTGDESLSVRPMKRVTEPLTAMGAQFRGQSRADKPGDVFAPLEIVVPDPTQRLRGMSHELKIASAQVKSAILLAGLYSNGPVTVKEPGPTRDHTERMLKYFGVPMETSRLEVTVDGPSWNRQLPGFEFDVPGDPSSAAFFVVAALITGARVDLQNVGMNSTRTGFVDVLSKMGATLELADAHDRLGEPIATIRVRPCAKMIGASVAGNLTVRSIDEIPILSVAAARAVGPTTICDAAELRVKESDRIATTCAMLRAFGVEVSETADGLTVHGNPTRDLMPARVEAHGDHRIAMAGAVLALCASAPSTIVDVENVTTSFPTFATLFRALGGDLHEVEV